MRWLDAVILGIVEGLTEFLPVSSTGHLTVLEKLLGYQIADRGVTAFTAVIQVGAILAAIVFFARDIVRLGSAWFRGLTRPEHRGDAGYKLGWGVIVGVIPIVVIALVAKPLITGALRSLWVVAGALIVWSIVLWLADRRADANPSPRDEATMGIKDALVIGLWQCVALIPGVSRSGATISGALFRGIDRVTATRWSFFLGIPALTAAGLYEALGEYRNISETVGWGPTLVGMTVSFVVAYASIAWLLRFVATNKFTAFVIYRIVAGLAIIVLLLTGVVTPT